MTRTFITRVLMLAAATTLAFACTTTPASVAPSASVLTVQEQITATASGLDEALAAYKAGDAVAAERLAGDAYLEHFEFVEGPLEEVDKEFMEDLEDLIREQLRAAIRAGKPAAEVEAIVVKAKADLATAATKLQ
jgi:hypothetical protein